MARPTVVVYTRRQCGLCRKAEEVVGRVAAGRAAVELVDVDEDPELQERYTLRVPVVAVDGREIAEYEVSRDVLLAAIGQPRRLRIVGWAAVAVHLAIGVFPYSFTGLLAPPAGATGLMAGWIVLFVVLLRVRRRRPARAPFVPLAAVALWFVVLWAGDVFLGWTA